MPEQLVQRHFEDTSRTRRKRQLRFAAKCKFKLQQNTNSFCGKTPGVFCSKTKLQVAAKRKRILQQNENTRPHNPKNPEPRNNRPINEFHAKIWNIDTDMYLSRSKRRKIIKSDRKLQDTNCQDSAYYLIERVFILGPKQIRILFDKRVVSISCQSILSHFYQYRTF